MPFNESHKRQVIQFYVADMELFDKASNVTVMSYCSNQKIWADVYDACDFELFWSKYYKFAILFAKY